MTKQRLRLQNDLVNNGLLHSDQEWSVSGDTGGMGIGRMNIRIFKKAKESMIQADYFGESLVTVKEFSAIVDKSTGRLVKILGGKNGNIQQN